MQFRANQIPTVSCARMYAYEADNVAVLTDGNNKILTLSQISADFEKRTQEA